MVSRTILLSIIASVIAVGVTAFAGGFALGERGDREKSPAIEEDITVVYRSIQVPVVDDYTVVSTDPELVMELVDSQEKRNSVRITATAVAGGVFDWIMGQSPKAVAYPVVVASDIPGWTYYVPEGDYPGALASTKTVFDIGGERYILETRGWQLQEHVAYLFKLREIQ